MTLASVITTSQMEFADKVLPSLFHDTPTDFLRFLRRDGNKFLRFYWNQAGTNQQVSTPESPFGLNYDIRKPNSNTTIALVIMPKPRVILEAYFVALIYRPLRSSMFWGVSDTTKVVALELATNPDEEPITQLRIWSRELTSEVIHNGPVPKVEKFYDTILYLI